MLFKRGKEKEKEGKKSEIRNVQRLEDGRFFKRYREGGRGEHAG